MTETSTEIWAFAEFRSGELTNTTTDLVTESRRLADRLNGSVSVIAICPTASQWIDNLGGRGADRIFVAENDHFSPPGPEAISGVVADLVRSYQPFLLLFSSTCFGNDLAARVAAKLGVGMITRADLLSISDEGDLVAKRLCCEQKIHETICCRAGHVHVVTLEQGQVKALAAPVEKPKIITVEIPQDLVASERLKITGLIKADPRTMDISDAEVIVAGGKGVNSNEGFDMIWGLADVLKAAVAGSRMAVDNGYIGRDRQIGQSGKTVSPELLISCGISGAHAHLAGMRDAKTIISINTDRNAPMIRMADLGAVGDLREILPRLIEIIRKQSN